MFLVLAAELLSLTPLVYVQSDLVAGTSLGGSTVIYVVSMRPCRFVTCHFVIEPMLSSLSYTSLGLG